ncbi:MAG: hypothetical protein U1F43_26665 [Myxococcota bacterium]
MAGLAAVADGQLLLGTRQAERADHEGRQRVGELRLEHRAFARHHAVVDVHGVGQELREDLRDLQLAHAREVAARARLVDGGDGECQMLVTEQVTELTNHLGHAHIGAGVARAGVADQQELERLPRLPLVARVDGIARLRHLDEAGHRAHQHLVGVERSAGHVLGLADQVGQQPAPEAPEVLTGCHYAPSAGSGTCGNSYFTRLAYW